MVAGIEGLERGVTAFGDNVEFVKEESEKKEKKFLEEQLKKEITESVSKQMRMFTTSWSSRRQQEDSGMSTGPKGPGGKLLPNTGKYIPPSQRKDDQNTLLVTNISEDADEQELRSLFLHYGPVSRFHLSKDRATNKVRGFAFITYVRKENAERAMESLRGHSIDHLILSIEWADKK